MYSDGRKEEYNVAGDEGILYPGKRNTPEGLRSLRRTKSREYLSPLCFNSSCPTIRSARIVAGLIPATYVHICTLYDVDMSEDGAKTPLQYTNPTQPPEHWPVAGEDRRCSHCCYCRVSRATRRRLHWELRWNHRHHRVASLIGGPPGVVLAFTKF